jgi:hypothetical protein
MGSLIVRQEEIDLLPFPVQAQLAELPEAAQRDFFLEYQRRRKETPLAYLAHLVGLSEGYLDNWTTQILFWLSFSIGIGPFWWAINLLRMPGKVKRFNQNLSKKVLRYIHYKYDVSGKDRLATLKRGTLFEKPAAIRAKPVELKPRPWNPIDPQQPGVDHLAPGYILDHALETWEVVSAGQYDWEDGVSEKMLRLTQLGTLDSFLLVVRKEFNHLFLQKVQPVSIYAIHEGLEMEIQERKRPFNVIHYQGVAYFREYSKTGHLFELEAKDRRPSEIIAWTYYDEARRKVIRVERYDDSEFRAFSGEVTSPLDFSEIMRQG